MCKFRGKFIVLWNLNVSCSGVWYFRWYIHFFAKRLVGEVLMYATNHQLRSLPTYRSGHLQKHSVIVLLVSAAPPFYLTHPPPTHPCSVTTPNQAVIAPPTPQWSLQLPTVIASHNRRNPLGWMGGWAGGLGWGWWLCRRRRGERRRWALITSTWLSQKSNSHAVYFALESLKSGVQIFLEHII